MRSSIELEVKITDRSKTYPIIISRNIFETIHDHFDFAKYTKIAIITDENVARFWLESLRESLSNFEEKITVITLPPGEKHKNLQVVETCWQKLSEAKFDRHSLVVALGGGVVGDMAGFVSSTYMRGIDYIQIPTTLIAQADSSVGGKTGFDFLGQKNNIGAFYQPRAVLIDTDTLTTLPRREYVQGFAEIIKYGLIADANFFAFLESKQTDNFSTEELIDALKTSLGIKKEIVENDLLEQTGKRKLLNFGHTLGHAVESLSHEFGDGLLHGEAVAIGMVGESWLSWQEGLIRESEFDEIKSTIAGLQLPTDLSYFDGKIEQGELQKKLIRLIESDKKNIGNEVRWTLLEKIGQGIADYQLKKANLANYLVGLQKYLQP